MDTSSAPEAIENPQVGDDIPLTPRPSLIASTLDTYSCTIAESLRREQKLIDIPPATTDVSTNPYNKLSGTEDIHKEVNYFKQAQWYVERS